jgi:hypothetical protein
MQLALSSYTPLCQRTPGGNGNAGYMILDRQYPQYRTFVLRNDYPRNSKLYVWRSDRKPPPPLGLGIDLSIDFSVLCIVWLFGPKESQIAPGRMQNLGLLGGSCSRFPVSFRVVIKRRATNETGRSHANGPPQLFEAAYCALRGTSRGTVMWLVMA